MAEASDSNDAGDGGSTPAKSSRNLIIIGLITAGWVGGGAGMYIASSRQGGPAAAPAAAPGAEGEGEAKGAPEAGSAEETVVTMASFVANLTPDVDGEMHYLKCTLAIALANPGAEKALEQKTPKVRNQIIMYLSSLNAKEVQGIDNKRKLVAHLLEIVKEAMGAHAVNDIYLTEFLIQ